MSRKKIIAGNWKMYKTLSQANELVGAIADGINVSTLNAEIWITPPAIYIHGLVQQFGNTALRFGAQDLSKHAEGAYTGEVSAAMLQSIGAYYSLVGHSERRQYHHENDTLIGDKITAALSQNLMAVYCCGETLNERNSGNHFNIVEQQISTALFRFSATELNQIVIAYEPVWAIGTGVTASAAQAQEMHAFIRGIIAKQFGDIAAEQIRILYGGSVKPNNAAELFSQPDIDGGLIGGASLVADDFLKIIQGAN
jgi:triosephosphate isomerase